jgi:hypothetical protein
MSDSKGKTESFTWPNVNFDVAHDQDTHEPSVQIPPEPASSDPKFLTIGQVANQLSALSGEGEPELIARLEAEVRGKVLELYRHTTKEPYLFGPPQNIRDFWDFLKVDEVNGWLAKRGVSYRLGKQETEQPVILEPTPALPVDPPSGSAAEVQSAAPLGRREQQIQAIIACARRFDYDPLHIPLGGKKRIEGECLKGTKLFPPSAFKAAWREASTSDRIRIEGKDRFS